MQPSSCKQIEALFSYSIDGEPIPEHEHRAFQIHIETCKDCQQRLAGFRQTDTSIRKALNESIRNHISTDLLDAFLNNQIYSELKKIQITRHLDSCTQCMEIYQRLIDLDKQNLFFSYRLRALLLRIQLLEKWKALWKNFSKKPLAVRVLAPVMASVILFISSYSFIKEISGPVSLPQLADTEPYPYIEMGLRRSDHPAGDAVWLQAMDYYQHGDYHEAIFLLRDLIQEHPENHQARFFLGVSHYLAGQPDKAAYYLNTAVQHHPNDSKACWYLAQVYLKQNDKGHSRDMLEKTVSLGQEPFLTKARRLLKKMK
ncbi:tetratricopeptide repeat protein [bacterium]|nr:tetratricopeptide repeat protein [bacterium]RQV97975.1 MAG: hypothetical protein EH221_03185 [bacterium]